MFEPAVAGGGDTILLSRTGGFVGDGALQPVGVEEGFEPEAAEVFAVLEAGLGAKQFEREAVMNDEFEDFCGL